MFIEPMYQMQSASCAYVLADTHMALDISVRLMTLVNSDLLSFVYNCSYAACLMHFRALRTFSVLACKG
jgi:hypothetical protein